MKLVFLLLMSSLWALPMNNPMQSTLICESSFCEQPCGYNIYGLFNARLGFYGDYVFNTAMKVGRPNRHDSIQDVAIMTNAGEIDLIVCGADIFWVVGVTKMHIKTPLSTFQTNTAGGDTELYIEGESDVSWGMGARFALWDGGDWGLGIEGEYFTTHPHITSVMDLGSGFVNYLEGMAMRYRAWQIGVGVNVDMPLSGNLALDPYAGIFWTSSRLDFGDVMLNNLGVNSNQSIRLYRLKKERQYGWCLGLTLLAYQRTTVTMEGRFGGEKGSFLSAQLQY